MTDNDIPDIIARFRKLEAEKGRRRTEKSFFVPKAEIVDNGYDLSINKYKKTEYKLRSIRLPVRLWRSCGGWRRKLARK